MPKVRMMKKYADFIAEYGLNAGGKRDVVIYCDVEMFQFVRYLTAELYKYKVRRVSTHYSDSSTLRQWLINTPETRLIQSAHQRIENFKEHLNSDETILILTPESPHMTKRVHEQRLSLYSHTLYDSFSLIDKRSLIDSQIVFAVVPTRSWAAEIFPDRTPAQALEKLWKIIYESVDVTDLSILDSEKRKNEYNVRLNRINAAHIGKVHISIPSTGTDVSVKIAPQSHFETDICSTLTPVDTYLCNFPSRQIYFATHAYDMEGTVVTTGSIYLNGIRYDKVKLTFKDGLISSLDAGALTEDLKSALREEPSLNRPGSISFSLLENGRQAPCAGLGNMTLDRSSGCCLTLGCSEARCIQDGIMMTESELASHGMNRSHIRWALPLFAPDMKVVGIAENDDGTKSEIPLIDKATWLI